MSKLRLFTPLVLIALLLPLLLLTQWQAHQATRQLIDNSSQYTEAIQHLDSALETTSTQRDEFFEEIKQYAATIKEYAATIKDQDARITQLTNRLKQSTDPCRASSLTPLVTR